MSDLVSHGTRLARAVEAFDRAEVHAVCADFVAGIRSAEAPDREQEQVGADILQLLRTARHYDDLVTVADALTAAGVVQPLARRFLAQSFADRGATATARVMFRSLVAEAAAAEPVSPWDLSEAEGGVARCEKDLFVTTAAPLRRAGHLREAYRSYRRIHDRDPEVYHWQGINAAGLAARAAREGIDLAGVPDPAEEARTLAEEVLRTTSRSRDPGPWPVATACEAHVTLGRYEEAFHDAQLLLNHRGIGAFHVNALIRQLTALWQVDADHSPGADLLSLLRSNLLAREGSTVMLAPREVVAGAPDAAGQEKVFGADRFRTLAWYQRGLECCRAVCRIESELGDPIGTGFLVAPGDLGLGSGLGDGPVVVTNAHVIPDGEAAREAFAVFEGLGAGRNRFAVRSVLWTSPPTELDTTVVLLEEGPAGVAPVRIARRLPNLRALTPARAYVIGHPQGMNLQFSLHDNRILDTDQVRLHYRSPTDHGSSGSPVFDNDWKVIGLHHAGSPRMPRLNGAGGVYQANEAITFRAIAEACRAVSTT